MADGNWLHCSENGLKPMNLKEILLKKIKIIIIIIKKNPR
jgi:hypothetical protein